MQSGVSFGPRSLLRTLFGPDDSDNSRAAEARSDFQSHTWVHTNRLGGRRTDLLAYATTDASTQNLDLVRLPYSNRTPSSWTQIDTATASLSLGPDADGCLYDCPAQIYLISQHDLQRTRRAGRHAVQIGTHDTRLVGRYDTRSALKRSLYFDRSNSACGAR